MSRLFSFIWMLCFPLTLISQEFNVSGRVCDSATLEPLAFVNIVINNGRQGGVSDIDGRFNLRSDAAIETLGFSYVGYNKLVLPVDKSSSGLQVKLTRFETELSEVLILAGENPAHRIIRNAVENRKLNNPSNIPSYAFTSYDKMIFTINADSLKGDGSTPLDSSDMRLLEVIENQHLFIMESVAEHKYLYPGRNHDKIIATRVSGLKDPLFVFLISQMQSASFYDDLISMAGTNYLNPISPNSEKLYFFHLKDTIYSEKSGDTTFVIGYKPRPGKNFDGMKGLLYISNNFWAIRNVIAEPARPNESFDMRIQQMYEFIGGRQWFPVQLNTEVVFNTINLNKSKPVGIGKSYRRDINLDAEVIGRQLSNIAVEITPEATRQNKSVWDKYRIDSLTQREINTYHIIDSLGSANSFDSKLKGLSALLSGKLPLGYVDLDLNRILRYNAYEGFYLGLGLHTSERLTKRASIGGYAGYGFADKDVKYGADLLIKLERYGNATLKVSYAYDLLESGGTAFFDDNISVFTPENYRRFYVTRMDISETAEAMMGFRMFRYLKAGLGIARSHKKASYEYVFQHSQDDPYVLTSDHTFGKLVAGIKFAWGEKFIRSSEKQASLGTRFPVMWIQYTGGRKGLLDGQFNYDRFDLKLTYSFITRLIGKTSIQLAGGLINHAAPCSEMFNGQGSRASTISVFSPGSFATMRTDEFLNDKFGAIFLTHNFGNLLFRSENFEPEFAVVLNAGVGSLKEPWRHRFTSDPAVSMKEGYYEGGFLVNNLLKTSISGLGFGLFCRMGPYSFDEFKNNLTFKLSLSFNL
ncbi:MAG: carboxypeptidase-like regulatory domain-containing protein [Bacteroidales bacterium]|nr:carboxypeptidase-like regulatory domain-containing protein [Bacteroidales bacterium]